jgi:hypothetical protein
MNDQRKLQAVLNHRNNMASSLQHRMAVARAKNDQQLLSILEQEQRQLGLG